MIIELVGGPFDGTKDYELDTIGKPIEDLKTGDLVWIPGPVGLMFEIKNVQYKVDVEKKKAYYTPEDTT